MGDRNCYFHKRVGRTIGVSKRDAVFTFIKAKPKNHRITADQVCLAAEARRHP